MMAQKRSSAFSRGPEGDVWDMETDTVPASRQRGALAWLVILAAGAGLVLLALQWMTTFSSDDYYYALFWREGPADFLQKNWEHFLQRNGRVVVHMLAETALALGTPVFALMDTAMLSGILFLFLRCQQGEGSIPLRGWTLGWAVFWICLATADYRVMRSWFLCVADAFNYIYPLLAIALLLYVLQFRRPGPGGAALVLVCALLAGASTEQGGAMALGLVLLGLLRALWTGKGLDRLALAALAAAALGLATIFASPATQQRAAGGLSMGDLVLGFVQYSSSLAAPGLSLPFLVLLCLTMGALPLTGQAPRGLYLGLPLAAILASGWLVPRSVGWNTGVTLLLFGYLLLSAAALILRSPHWLSGGMLLAGLGSAGLVMVSRSCSVRVTTPFVLLSLLCSVHFLLQLCRWLEGRGVGWLRPAALLLTAALAAGLALQGPALAGVWHNWQIRQENERLAALARETGVLTYRDYDPDYCLQMLFSNEIISSLYLRCHRLSDVQVESTYSSGPETELGGQRVPTLLHKGKSYVMLATAVEIYQGRLELITDNYFTLELAGRSCLYHGPFLYLEGERLDFRGDVLSYQNRMYLSLEGLEQILGDGERSFSN